ncbi:2-phospho-L-lactate guanylyltransferase [Sphingobium sp. MK2]|uniref:2-phospho-L-lactate guanylyltransferase n=1 Tax=Sphingobium sp. MK2 TaxID=3116540 RepID=UPI0032E35CE3
MTGSISVVIPVKGGLNAKSRLAAALEPSDRLALARDMAVHVITTARGSMAGERVIVVTGCVEMASLAHDLGARVIHDPLNEGTAAACLLAMPLLANDEAILFLNADLPLVQPESLNAMIGIGAPVMIAPDRHREGTNALMVCPRTGIHPSFGRGSFSRHYMAAADAGIIPVIINDLALAHDIDVAEDLVARHAAATLLQRRAA